MIRKAKRHMLLLEVLIALVLVALCAFPLLAPHFMMINQEKLLLQEIEADRMANVIFVNLVEKMHNGSISWEEISGNGSGEVDGDLLEGVNAPKQWPYVMTYRFETPQVKPSQSDPRYGLFPVWIEMKPKKGEDIRFFYEVFVEKGRGDEKSQ